MDVLVTWMGLGGDDEDEELPGAHLHRALRNEAFSLVSTLRTLYPQRLKYHRYSDLLAFNPSTDVVNGLRRVFELEGARIKRLVLAQEEVGAAAVEDNDDAEVARVNQVPCSLRQAPRYSPR